MYSRRLTVPAVLAAAALAAGCSARGGQPAAPAAATAADVTLTAAQRQHIHLFTVAASAFRETLDTTGTVEFDQNRATSVIAPFSGPVKRLLVETGRRVAQGAPLAVVDSPDFAAAVSAYRKALATEHTARRLASMDADLLRHHGIAEREASQAMTDAANAAADRDAARQALVALNVEPRTIEDIEAGRPVGRLEGVIRAPIAGTVVEKLISPGELLQAGSTPCFTVANLAHVWVDARIFGADIDAVAPGDPAQVLRGAGARPLPGTVTNISAVVNTDTRAVTARVIVDNASNALKKGMYVRVLIHSRNASTGLLVPVSAILRDDENLPFLYLARPGGGFARRHVTLGYRDGAQVDITAGLHPGDQVVVEGGIFLQFIQNQ
ncbi:MAG: efflux RND transporter periplasmic adaptor subunit [Gammaproteobacteria bacterium]|nr:efflux RND transporter periplasmic adaptor subunit [Gammaproteobacteria bacterium]